MTQCRLKEGTSSVQADPSLPQALHAVFAQEIGSDGEVVICILGIKAGYTLYRYDSRRDEKRHAFSMGDMSVDDNIQTKEVKLDLNGWADFVFEKDYKLPTLEEVEIEHKHLPEIPNEGGSDAK